MARAVENSIILRPQYVPLTLIRSNSLQAPDCKKFDDDFLQIQPFLRKCAISLSSSICLAGKEQLNFLRYTPLGSNTGVDQYWSVSSIPKIKINLSDEDQTKIKQFFPQLVAPKIVGEYLITGGSFVSGPTKDDIEISAESSARSTWISKWTSERPLPVALDSETHLLRTHGVDQACDLIEHHVSLIWSQSITIKVPVPHIFTVDEAWQMLSTLGSFRELPGDSNLEKSAVAGSRIYRALSDHERALDWSLLEP